MVLCFALIYWFTTNNLSKGRQFIVQDLLASKGLTYTEVQEGLLITTVDTYENINSKVPNHELSSIGKMMATGK